MGADVYGAGSICRRRIRHDVRIKKMKIKMNLIHVLAVAGAMTFATLGCQANAQAWAPVGRAPDISVSSTVTAEALGAVGSIANICNAGPSIAYVALGGSSITTTALTGDPVIPGACLAENASGKTYIAAITDSGNSTILKVSIGNGVPIGFGGSANNGSLGTVVLGAGVNSIGG